MKGKLFQILILVGTAFSAIAAPPEQPGKTIFTARCASCHAVNQQLTGPALAGVDQRHTIDWIINFVHSSQGLVKSGDKQAVALFDKFKIQMPDHPDLTADNIKEVVAFIKSEAGNGGDKAPFAKPARLHPSFTPLIYANTGFFVSYLVVVSLLVLALLFAVQIKQYERQTNTEE